MHMWIRPLAITALLLIASISSLADIANPNSNRRRAPVRPDAPTSMRIQPDEKAKGAKLLIPRGVLNGLRASLDEGDPQSSGSAGVAGITGGQTIMVGIFLSLSLAFAGIWLMKSRAQSDRLTRAAVVIAILGLGTATTSVVLGNAGPPPVARSLTSKILTPELEWWGAYGQVTVEIVQDGDQITLVLPRQKDQQ
jgi:hypothetical protein